MAGSPPRKPLPRTDSVPPIDLPESVGAIPSLRPIEDDDRLRRVETVANAALQGVTSLRADFDGQRAGIEAHIQATVKAEIRPVQASLARQDATLAQILELAEAQQARAHKLRVDTLSEEIQVEDLRGKRVANEHAIEIDPRIDGAHKRRVAWVMAIAAVLTALGALFGASAASHGHAPAPASDEPHH